MHHITRFVLSLSYRNNRRKILILKVVVDVANKDGVPRLARTPCDNTNNRYLKNAILLNHTSSFIILLRLLTSNLKPPNKPQRLVL